VVQPRRQSPARSEVARRQRDRHLAQQHRRDLPVPRGGGAPDGIGSQISGAALRLGAGASGAGVDRRCARPCRRDDVAGGTASTRGVLAGVVRSLSRPDAEHRAVSRSDAGPLHVPAVAGTGGLGRGMGGCGRAPWPRPRSSPSTAR
jgi:hypothetical protein